MLAAVGRGQISPAAVLREVHPDYRDERASTAEAGGEEGWTASGRSGLRFRLPAGDATTSNDGIPIRGLDSEIPVRFAPNGGAVPGDRIVGIFTPGEGLTIFPIHSPELGRFDDEPERWVDVRWDISQDSSERFPARIRVTALNEPGTLAAIADVIGAADGNIDNLRMLGRGRDFTEIEIDLEVWNLKHLNRIVTGLRGKRVVSHASRVNG
jgi:guanosine-3',5'-bis(diphosphate) 3'-pyrophosphohydrolase